MEFLSIQTFACRENVSVWTEHQTDKTGSDILERFKTLPCAHSLNVNRLFVGCSEQLLKGTGSESGSLNAHVEILLNKKDNVDYPCEKSSIRRL